MGCISLVSFSGKGFSDHSLRRDVFSRGASGSFVYSSADTCNVRPTAVDDSFINAFSSWNIINLYSKMLSTTITQVEAIT